MLTKKPTKEMLREWNRVFEENHRSMKPNRITGEEVDSYFKSKYQFDAVDSQELADIVASDIVDNEANREKIPDGSQPEIKTYMKDDIFVGIDITTGYFHVESENIEKIVPIYDDLFVFRGLDEQDLKNPFLVAEYIRLTHKQA